MKRSQRAMQIWSLLICAARERKSYTYGHLADILGMNGAGVFSQTLGKIMDYCEDNNYPPLTVLVVNKKTGLHGKGLTTVEYKKENSDRERVFQFDWFQVKPPTTRCFEKK